MGHRDPPIAVGASSSKDLVVLFDGVCNLCNASVDFIIPRDKAGRFRFSSLQSEAGRRILTGCGLDPSTVATVVLVEEGRCYTLSAAALRVAKHLSGLWPALYILTLVPTPIRDLVYRWIARNRYKWFGRRETCRLPMPEERGRFIE
jgi:predicted DCC family thiol-disulfide oxidoreductase YuxK